MARAGGARLGGRNKLNSGGVQLPCAVGPGGTSRTGHLPGTIQTLFLPAFQAVRVIVPGWGEMVTCRCLGLVRLLPRGRSVRARRHGR